MNKKGFTLVELLVVIAIIGLLAAVAVVGINPSRQKARDAKRVADIRQVQTALEQFYDDCGSYPTALTTAVANGCTGGTTFGNFMASVPVNPSPGGAAYTYTSAGSTYTLTFTLEGATGGLASGVHTASPAGVN